MSDYSQVLVPRQRRLRRSGRSVNETDGNGDEEERDDERQRSGPGDPCDLVQSLDGGQKEDEDGSNGNKDGGASSVQGHGVESDRDGQESGTSDSGHPKPVDGSADVSTGLSKNDITDVGDRVDFGVSVLEFAHLVGSVCEKEGTSGA